MEATRLAIFLLAIFSFSTISSQSQPTLGQWKLLTRSIGISAMHMIQLPNNKVIAFDRTDFGPSNISLPSGKCRTDSHDQALTHDCYAHSVEFDPSDGSVRPLTVLTDTWCSSGALSSNGMLVQIGGYNDGDHAVRYFSPCENCDWVENKNGLTMRRWYATSHILPDSRIIVVGGRAQFNYEFLPKSSASSDVFRLPFLKETRDASENNLYPFVHLSTDGYLFIFANTKAILLDYIKNQVVKNFPEMPGGISRNYPSTGSSVLLPIKLKHRDSSSKVKAEVMICGGSVSNSYSMAVKGNFLSATSTCGLLRITDPSPEWVMEEMPIGRVMGDMVLLPTGDVLIINGAGMGSAGWGLARDPVMHPVLYRSGIASGENPMFEVMNPSVIPRVYHSTAHLLSDGRVLVGGSNTNKKYEFSGVLFPTELSLEAFSPPYLFSEDIRPEITSLDPGSEFGYGEQLSVDFELINMEEGVVVTMVAPSFNTHSFSMNQRLLVLEGNGLRQVSGGRYAVDVFAPANKNLAPPGYYLLFVVHGGVPSPGKWVLIK